MNVGQHISELLLSALRKQLFALFLSELRISNQTVVRVPDLVAEERHQIVLSITFGFELRQLQKRGLREREGKKGRRKAAEGQQPVYRPIIIVSESNTCNHSLV
jgi:hypothetical protein